MLVSYQADRKYNNHLILMSESTQAQYYRPDRCTRGAKASFGLNTSGFSVGRGHAGDPTEPRSPS